MAEALPLARFVGTPLLSAKRQHELRKTQVLDEEGRSRFHGAFTGGFSAGYYNTVGSASGWQPSQYVRGKTLSVGDYMDEDDEALLGDKIQARQEFRDPLEDQKREASTKHLWGSAESSAIPGPIPKELLWSTEQSKSTDNQSMGKRLYLACCSRETRRQRFLSNVDHAIRKQAPLIIKQHGVGYRPPAHERLMDPGQSVDSRELVRWKKGTSGAISNRNYYGEEDDEDVEQPNLSFEVVEIPSDDDSRFRKTTDRYARVEEMTARALTAASRKPAVSRETWPDGFPLPPGFALAKRHDPNKLMAAKAKASTPIPEGIPVIHEFEGTARPPVAPSSGLPPVPALKAEDSKAVLASRFSRAGATSAVANHLALKSKSDTFQRTSITWIPSEAMRKAFGVSFGSQGTKKVSGASSVFLSKDVPMEVPLSSGTDVGRPSIAEFRRVLGRHRDEEEEFHSSDSSSLADVSEKAKLSTVDATSKRRRRSRSRSPPRKTRAISSASNSSSTSSSERDHSRRHRKLKKHRKQKSSKRRKRKSRRKRSRSPSSSSATRS